MLLKLQEATLPTLTNIWLIFGAAFKQLNSIGLYYLIRFFLLWTTFCLELVFPALTNPKREVYICQTSFWAKKTMDPDELANHTKTTSQLLWQVPY